MEMIAEINSFLKYAMKTNMLARQDKMPTSSRHSMKSIVDHLTQINIPTTSPQQPSKARILMGFLYALKTLN
jgi:hypothetical protein